jgi:hypothetical protein
MNRRDSVPLDHQRELSSIIEISWSVKSTSEVESAKKKFEEYTRQGWLAFKLASDNRKVQVYEFDPCVEEIFLVPLAEGG